MRSLMSPRAARLRGMLFATCLVCTLWLVVQNAILFSIVSWDHLPGLVHAGDVVRGLVNGVLVLSLVPTAFGLGWAASRGPRRGAALEDRHE